MSAIATTHEDLLERKGFAHLASIGPDGEPQSHPVWYASRGDRVLISTTEGRQKLRNVQRDRRVSLTIQDPDDPYRYIEVRGRVVDVEDDPDRSFIDSLAQKYLDQPEYPFHQPGDQRRIIVVEPVKSNTMG